MNWFEDAKKRAAQAAVIHVKNNSIIGLGSGSTALHAIRLIGERINSGELRNIQGIPTSHQAAIDATIAGIPLTNLYKNPKIDLTIDGVDQINEKMDALKGRGGALLREKVVASVSKKYFLVADERKLSSSLCKGCPLPVEVLPFALGTVISKVKKLGSSAIVRSGTGKLGPVITDNGNFIIDIHFKRDVKDLDSLDSELNSIPGVLETGFFLGYATAAYIGTKDDMKKLEK